MSNKIDWTAYLAQCKKTVSPRANTAQLRELMFTIGLAGEVGEVVEAVKKAQFHEMDEDQARAKILEESGDVLWYFIQLLDMYDIEIDEVVEHNIEKLQRRHKEGKFKAGYASDTVLPHVQRKLVLMYGFSGDVDNYIAEKIKARKHEREVFYMGSYNNLELVRAFSNGYETVYVDAERGCSPSDAYAKQQALLTFGPHGITIETVDIPPGKLDIS